MGYTNAGKSTLMNTITKAGIYADNLLFATLDTSVRNIKLNDKGAEKIAKIDEEMLKILKNAEDNAHSLGSKLIEESNQQIELIKESSKKAIENNFKSVKNEILKETGEKAMQIAESKIKSELENNYDLHKKFIYESLDSLDNIGVQV